MIQGKTLKTMLAVAAVVGVAFAAPNKHEMSNEIVPAGGSVTKNGDTVSASWGGFQASASLADDGTAAASAGGNGLGAGAGYASNGAGAGAGVYGTGASAGSASAGYPSGGGYGNSGKPGSSGAGAGNAGGFFDRIFAIPINVLQSVNTYLNQKQQGQTGMANGHPVKPGSSADKVPEGDYGHGGASAGAATGSGAYAEAGTKVGHGKTDSMMVHKNTNYNDIFNIPITALRSVQNLLNG